MSKCGKFIVSLDFELNWGVHDVFTIDQYKENIIGVRKAIPQMLELFNEFNIHATWATVGMLFAENKKELIESLPAIRPSYTNPEFSPYGKLKEVGENEEIDPIHFGLSLIRTILKYPNQELASHTFSHYYCLEEGQTINEFEKDLKASLKVGISKAAPLTSIIFPRNQTNHEYLEVCKNNGIQSYRGNEKSWVYKASKFKSESPLKRILRLSDSYFNIFGYHTYPLSKVDTSPIVNLPSSSFLRPVNKKLKLLEPLRLRRIKNSIINAAKNNEVFHLWWHPHNFGKDVEENIMFLKEILELVLEMRNEYGFESLTMEEASTLVLDLSTEKSDLPKRLKTSTLKYE